MAVTDQHGQSSGRPTAPTAVAQSSIAIASMPIKLRRHDRRRRSRVWSWKFSAPKLTNNRLFDCNAQLTTRVEEAYDTIGVNMPKLSFTKFICSAQRTRAEEPALCQPTSSRPALVFAEWGTPIQARPSVPRQPGGCQWEVSSARG